MIHLHIVIRFSSIQEIDKTWPSGINKNTVAFLYNVVGENSWCSETLYVHRQILYKLYLVGRIMKCQFARTILTNRKILSNLIKKPKFCIKSTIIYPKSNTLVLVCKDKRIVTCSTNWYNAGLTYVKRILRGGVKVKMKKPNAIINYIIYMGSIDCVDQYASIYCFLRKSLRWWQKLFCWSPEIDINGKLHIILTWNRKDYRFCSQ